MARSQRLVAGTPVRHTRGWRQHTLPIVRGPMGSLPTARSRAASTNKSAGKDDRYVQSRRTPRSVRDQLGQRAKSASFAGTGAVSLPGSAVAAFMDTYAASTVTHSSPVPGWFGKIPCLGDFASRRLPDEFITPWDRWLQSSLIASRQQLGDGWLDVFLKSPMWRFALAPGVCGEQAWAGLLLPSVDKVGRYYPLTFALPAPAQSGLLLDLLKAQDWYSALEDVALSALNVDFSVEQLERALSEITSALAPADERAAAAARALIADL